MSQSEEWEKISHVKKSTKGVLATATLVKPTFWNGVSLCLRVFEPLVKVLHMVDGDIKPSMAWLYGEILKAKEEMRMAVGYNKPSIFDSEDVMDGFIVAVETFYHGDYDKQNQMLNDDFHKFKDKVGHFGKKLSGGQLWNTSSNTAEIHTKKRNRLTCERVEQLVFVRFNHLHAKRKNKAKKNKKTDPLVETDATFAQGWMVQGADEEGTDVEPVTGLTWKLIADTCGAEEVTKLRKSARLAHAKEVEEEPKSDSDEQPINEEDIEFESDQDNVVTTGYQQEGEEDSDG
ncbi:uncharacterized protein LOC112873038 [Panicum hallii]|uniref:uncharacterized protein LOC112873038 n=1 Tax=Panicum hallii TaxID=206008 RepID=UPI000DF4EA9B|nr:uncharacterized protein LOC112873038 [Panicum hallii]